MLDEDGFIATDSEGGAQGFLVGLGSAGDGDEFGGDIGFFEFDGFFDGDFAEGVHRHFDIIGFDTGAIGAHAHFDIGIYDSFYADNDLHF